MLNENVSGTIPTLVHMIEILFHVLARCSCLLGTGLYACNPEHPICILSSNSTPLCSSLSISWLVYSTITIIVILLMKRQLIASSGSKGFQCTVIVQSPAKFNCIQWWAMRNLNPFCNWRQLIAMPFLSIFNNWCSVRQWNLHINYSAGTTSNNTKQCYWAHRQYNEPFRESSAWILLRFLELVSNEKIINTTSWRAAWNTHDICMSHST